MTMSISSGYVRMKKEGRMWKKTASSLKGYNKLNMVKFDWIAANTFFSGQKQHGQDQSWVKPKYIMGEWFIQMYLYNT